MIFKRTDISFAGDETHRFLPWLIGVMSGLTVLFLCIGISLGGWIIERHGNYDGRLTVTIPSGISAEKIEQVRTTVAKMPDVKNVALLKDNELADMLKPWLGERESLRDLPVPTVLNVELARRAATPDYAALQKQLQAIADGVEIDSHEQWAAAFQNFSVAARGLMILLSVVLLAAMGTLIAFAARASLKLHSRTVMLLHAIGAEDDYIARQFQQQTLLLVLRGACFGSLAAGVIYGIASLYIAALNVSTLPALSFSVGHIVLLLLAPPLAALAAWLVARLSVRQQLERVL